MTEPKYDEDAVNLGYLKKVIFDTEENIEDTYKNVSRHYASKPNTPYYKGDTWIDGNIVYTCINSREIGLYTDSDWTTESGAKQEAESKNKTYLTQPSNYSAGDMWILQSDNDHKAGKKGEILISSAGRKEYNENDWTNMLGYGTIKSINEVSNNLNNAINRIGNVEEAIQDGIIITFYQSSIPEAKHVGDLWYVTDELEGYIKGKIYRYDGTSWVVLNDPAIQEAFDEANEARLVADGKIQSFYSNTEPTENMGVGDLWIDLANNNQLYRYNGTNWVAVYDTRINDLVTSVDSVTERVTTIETDLGEIDLKVQENTTTITTIEGNVNNITNTQAQSEGKNIHIEDSAEEPFVDVELYGETSQKTRSGKNFFDKTKFKAINNATYTYSNGIYAITPLGTANVSLDIYINLPAGIYTYSGNGSNATQVKNSSGTTIANNVSSSNTTFTITEEGTYIRFNWGTGTSTDAFTLDTNNIQIESGSTATDYEEYGVMPSPDYPSEIENVEGKNLNSGLRTGYYQANTGEYFSSKNYSCSINPVYVKKGARYAFSIDGLGIDGYAYTYDKNNNYLGRVHIGQSNGYLYIPTEDVYYFHYAFKDGTIANVPLDSKAQIEEGTVATPYVPYNSLEFKVEGKNKFDINKRLQGTINSDGDLEISRNVNKFYEYDFKENTQYTFSAYVKNGNENKGNVRFKIVYKDGTENGEVLLNRTTIYEYITYTSALNKTIDYISINYGSEGIMYIKNGELQIEEGTQATPYEPYKSQVETFPLVEGQKLMEGSYLADDGIHNVRGQVVFDGSDDENWQIEGANNFYSNIVIQNSKSSSLVLCNYQKSINKGLGESENCFISNSKKFNFQSDTINHTVADFKNWLSTHNLIVEYDLAEPETVPYTEEQQEAREKLNNFSLYSPKSIITSSNDLAILKLIYYPVSSIDFETEYIDRIIGYADDLEAIQQAVYHILSIERNAYLIYDENYGVELEQYKGKDLDYIKATIDKVLKDALKHDLRITDVTVSNVEKITNDMVWINFTVNSIYGDLIMEVNVNV